MSNSLLTRRRTTPWIHRWSRQMIGAIALLGILNAGYLTITKLMNASAICPTSGCERVLSSPYAIVFGLPLSLYGMVAYLIMAVLAFAPLAINPDDRRPLRKTLDQWTWLVMFIVATLMTVFSGYLMFIMVSKFIIPFGVNGICYYCLASALFAFSFFVLTLIGRDWEDIGQLFFTGVIVGMVTLVGTLAIYAPIDASASSTTPATATNPNGRTGPAIVNTSSQAEIELARHLKQTGAKMYSAYWCPHCYDQKELFGKEAVEQLPYLECAPDGKNSQTPLCKEAQARAEKQLEQPFGFPSWEINGRFYLGAKNLEDLANLSGYNGPRTFKNQS